LRVTAIAHLEETVQSQWYSGKVRPIVARQPCIPDQRIDLGFAQFDGQVAQAVALALATPAHALG
jgi:hypothetical protein